MRRGLSLRYYHGHGIGHAMNLKVAKGGSIANELRKSSSTTERLEEPSMEDIVNHIM
jgi:hypothetical protein